MDKYAYRRRLAQRPQAVRFAELRRLLELFGWRLDRVRGSHYVFTKGKQVFVAPMRRPHVGTPYVRDALRLTQEDSDV